MKLSLIKPNPDNPRIIKDKRYKQLLESMKRDPEYLEGRPIIIGTDSIILAGNMRHKAAKELKMEDVPVKDFSHLSEEKQRRFVMIDNEGFGITDWDLVADQYDMDELEEWGIELPDDLQPAQEIEEDEAPEVDEQSEPVSQPGEVYQLGRHRLMCGDSTKIEDVEKLMEGKKADMVFTDPPYGMKKEKDGVLNDNLNFNELLEFNKEWIPLTISNLKDSGSWYCWGIDEPLMDIYSNIIKPYIKENKMVFRNLITWDKGSGQGQNSDGTKMYATADEKCLFITAGRFGITINGEDYKGEWDEVIDYLKEEERKSGLSKEEIKSVVGKNMYSHYFTISQFTIISREKYDALASMTGCFKKSYDEVKKTYKDCKKRERINQFYFNNTHGNFNNVWHFDRTGNKEREGTGEHATPKPIELCSRAIKSSSRENEIVMDVFGGSGSTLIACEQTDRTCYMCELDPKYCDVIRKRYHKLVTGSDEGWDAE